MQLTISFLALLIAQVSAFSYNTVKSSKYSSLRMAGEKSKALPFLPKPAKLDGTSAVQIRNNDSLFDIS